MAKNCDECAICALTTYKDHVIKEFTNELLKDLSDATSIEFFSVRNYILEKSKAEYEKISPEEFKSEMIRIVEKYGDYDNEKCHSCMDDLMADLLISLGYKDGIDIFEHYEKWYC